MKHASLSMAQKILAGKRARIQSKIPRQSNRETLQPLSAAQSRLWFIEQVGEGGTEYNVPMVYRLEGKVDISVLQQSIDILVKQHEILRTVFVEHDGQPYQQIQPQLALPIEVRQFINNQQALAALEVDKAISFDLIHGPLIKVALYQTPHQVSYLMLNQHHIICDGWSITQLLQQLSSLYKNLSEENSLDLAAEKVQYLDYCHWSNEQDHSAGLDYWQQTLQDAEPLSLPAEGETLSGGGYHSFKLNQQIKSALLNRCDANGSTLFMALLGFYQLLLSRYSGQSDVSVGVAVANRPLTELAQTMGFFVNTLVMRQVFDQALNLDELLTTSKNKVLQGFNHQSVPFEQVVERLDPVRDNGATPLFRSMFVLQTSSDVNALQLPGLKTQWCSQSQNTAKFDITLNLRESADGIEGGFEYRNGMFTEQRISHLADCFVNLIQLALSHPSVDLMTVDYLPETLRGEILRNSRGPAAAISRSITEAFTAQVVSRPNKTALICGPQTQTYSQLNDRANQWACYLQRQGVQAGERVALAFHRNRTESIECMLAVLKLGAVYVPLDLTSPAQRLQYIVSHTGIRHLLTSDETLVASSKIHLVQQLTADINELPVSEISVSTRADQLCYVMYTSGTTGTPKGVMVGHQGVLRLVQNTSYIELTEQDVFLQSAPQAFDAATFEIWGALLNGATLVLGPQPQFSLQHISDLISEHQVSVLWLTAQLFHTLCDIDIDAFAGLRVLLAGGDVLSARRIKQLNSVYPELTLINGYGPTEVTTFSTSHQFCASDIAQGLVPIGRPIDNTAVYILDKNMCPVPPMCDGEMYMGGPGVGLGYFNNALQSAEVFIPDPFSSDVNARLYRSGDIARYDYNGCITFLGRKDGQVKVRGYRIELAEIRRALENCAGIDQAEVMVRDKGNDKQLLAYYVCKNGPLSPQQLRAKLKQQLPAYMLPQYFVHLQNFPTTRNGKVDRRQLPSPRVSDAFEDQKLIKPTSDTELRIAAIWQWLLSIDEIGSEHNFFELGGHSLLTARLRSRLQSEFGVVVQLRDVFNAPTIAAQAHLVEQAKPLQSEQIPQLTERDGLHPLSGSQQRLWFVEQLNPGGIEYSVPMVYRLDGELDLVVLQQSINALVARHEILRTTFVERDGQPWQQVSSDLQIKISVNDSATPAQAMCDIDEVLQQGFDLSHGPLVKVWVHLAGENCHYLSVNQHHIICDGWSVTRLFQELSEIYQSVISGQPQVQQTNQLQYLDYCYWLQTQNHQQDLAYWQQTLAGAERLSLTAEGDVVETGGYYRFNLDQPLSGSLTQLCQANGCTTFMALLGFYQVLLSRISGQSDISVGVPVANRSLEALDLQTLLANTRQQVLTGFEHQAVPFEQVVERIAPQREKGQTPLFNTMFVMQSASDVNALTLPGISTQWCAPPQNTAKFDLTLNLRETAQGIVGGFEYREGLFSEARIAQLASCLVQLIGCSLANENANLMQLDYLPDALRRDVLRMSINPHNPPKGSIGEIFAAKAAAMPNKIALIGAQRQLTYAQLEDLSNQWVGYFDQQGIKVGDRVGLAFHRNRYESIVCMLAVVKAGAIYVPIDLDSPAQRQNYIIEHTEIEHLFTSDKHLAHHSALTVHHVDDINEDIHNYRTTLLERQNPEGTCYIMFTSGTTGKPKGVVVNHRGVLRLVLDVSYVELVEQDVWLQSASQTFDAATFDIWGPLLNGATLVMQQQREFSLAHLADLVRQYQVSVLWLSAQLFHAMIDIDTAALAGLRLLLAGGDALSAEKIKQLKTACPDLKVINGYGPTEVTTFTTCHLLTEGDIKRGLVPIGKPIDNTNVYILDENKQLVPPMTAGQMYIGGTGVAQGYWNEPKMTAQSFMLDPFSSVENATMYQSGDLARYSLDGVISFIGRQDNQVKIRGLRIELDEVKHALEHHNEITQAEILLRSQGEDKQLVGYYTSTAGRCAPQELSSWMLSSLPAYMVPQYFVHIGHFPVTANGKLDRHQLPQPTLADTLIENELVLPRNQTETRIAAIWRNLLMLEEVGCTHNFFDLGGHSLLTARLQSRLQSEFSVVVTIKDIFATPTIEGLAKLIAIAKPLLSVVIPTQLKRTGPQPLSPAQERLWTIEQMMPLSTQYNVPIAYRLSGNIDKDILQQAVDALVQRHEILRTVFVEIDGQPWQIIDESPTITVDCQQFTSEQQAEAAIRDLTSTGFDLTKGPLIRVSLYQCAKNTAFLLINQHHIICDGWSVGLLFQQLGDFYQTLLNGKAVPLQPQTLQYLDYSHWSKFQCHSEDLNYWQDTLKGAQQLNLPQDSDLNTDNSGYYKFQLSQHSKALLNSLCQATDTTPFMALLGFYQILLKRYSGQTDISVGVPVANRPLQALESMFGFFVNTLVIRQQFPQKLTLKQLLAMTKEQVLAGFSHQSVPFEQVVGRLQPARENGQTPLFNTMFSVQSNVEGQGLSLPEVSSELFGLSLNTAKFDITLSLRETSQGFEGGIEYRASAFSETRIAQMAACYSSLIEHALTSPEADIFAMDYLPPALRPTLLPLQTSAGIGQVDSIAQVFTQQVSAHCNKTALVCGEHRLSYFELNAQANQWAHYLKNNGVEPGDIVAIALPADQRFVIAALAVIKCGGCYLTLDSDAPTERLRQILNDAQPKLLLVDNKLDHPATRQVIWKSHSKKVAACSSQDLVVSVKRLCPAYIIYTSGSTGVPKGVVNTHEGVLNLTKGNQRFNHHDVFAQVNNLCFDAAVFEIWSALLNGCSLVMVDKQQLLSPAQFAQIMKKKNINVALFTTALFNLYANEFAAVLANFRVLYFGGEAADPQSLSRLSPECRPTHLINAYGPSENAVITTEYPLGDLQQLSALVPIGAGISGSQIYLLDEHLIPVPPGVLGEIYICSNSLALGYLNRAEQTATAFIPNPFANDGSRLYHSGDLGYLNAQGDIQFCGRLDHQVKIRGHRVELGEVSTSVAAVITNTKVHVEYFRQQQLLVAYLVNPKCEIHQRQLKLELRSKLPGYMVPDHIIAIERLPLTANGKVDSANLPLPVLERNDEQPLNKQQQLLANCFARILNCQTPGLNQHFFELGGNSLLAVKLAGEINQQLHRQIPLSVLFANDTIAQLDDYLQSTSQIILEKPLTLLRQGTGDELIFAIHPVEGECACYLPLAEQLAPKYSITGIEHPLLHDLEVATDIQSLATYYLDQIKKVQHQGPYRLLGWSLGGVIAMEMAQQLHSENLTAKVVMLDSFNPNALTSQQRSLSPTGESALFEINRQAFINYETKAVDFDALLIHTKADKTGILVEDDGHNGWRNVFTNGLETTELGNHHHDMSSSKLASQISQRVNRYWS